MTSRKCHNTKETIVTDVWQKWLEFITLTNLGPSTKQLLASSYNRLIYWSSFHSNLTLISDHTFSRWKLMELQESILTSTGCYMMSLRQCSLTTEWIIGIPVFVDTQVSWLPNKAIKVQWQRQQLFTLVHHHQTEWQTRVQFCSLYNNTSWGSLPVAKIMQNPGTFIISLIAT